MPLRSKTAAHDGIKDWAVVHCNAAEPREASSASEERKHVYLLLLVFAGGSGGRCELVLQIFFFFFFFSQGQHAFLKYDEDAEDVPCNKYNKYKRTSRNNHAAFDDAVLVVYCENLSLV